MRPALMMVVYVDVRGSMSLDDDGVCVRMLVDDVRWRRTTMIFLMLMDGHTILASMLQSNVYNLYITYTYNKHTYRHTTCTMHIHNNNVRRGLIPSLRSTRQVARSVLRLQAPNPEASRACPEPSSANHLVFVNTPIPQTIMSMMMTVMM